MIPPSAHPAGDDGKGYTGMNVTSATVQQHILAGLEVKVVDVSAPKTCLQNSSTATVGTWPAMCFESRKGERMNEKVRLNASAVHPVIRKRDSLYLAEN